MDEDQNSHELDKALDGVIVSHRADQAYEMLMAGDSPSEVAKELGYASAKEVGRAIRERMASEAQELSQDARDGILMMELDRLNKLQRAHWESAMYGDVKSTEIVLKIMTLRVKLTGVDQPDAKSGQNTVLIVGGDEKTYIERLKGMAEGGD